MKLYKPLPPPVYDELRNLQHDLEELALDQDLEAAIERIAGIKRRVLDLILASDMAEQHR